MSGLTSEQLAAREQRLKMLPYSFRRAATGWLCHGGNFMNSIAVMRPYGVAVVGVVMWNAPAPAGSPGPWQTIAEVHCTEHLPIHGIEDAIKTLQDYLDQMRARGETHTAYDDDLVGEAE